MQHHCEKSARVLHVTNWASLFRAHFFSPQLGFISVFRVAKHICPDSDLLLLLFLIRARYLFFPGFLLVSQLNKHKHYTADKGDDFKIGCVVSCKCFLFNWRHFWRMNTAVLCSSLCVCVCVCSFNMSAEVNELAYIMRHRRWNERWKLHIRRTEETFAFFFPRQSPDLSLLPTSLSSASFFFSPLPFFFFLVFSPSTFFPFFFSGSCFTFRFWFVLYYGFHSSILPLPCFATPLTSRVVKTDTACSAWPSTTWPWSCGQRSSSAWAGWCARSQQAVSFTSNVVVPMATSLRDGWNKRKGSSKPVMGFRMSQKR